MAKLDNIFGNLGKRTKPGSDVQLVICVFIIKNAFKVSCTPSFRSPPAGPLAAVALHA